MEGIGTAHKLTIMSAIAFGSTLQFEEKAYTEGNGGISPADIGFAEELGYRIKALGIAGKRSVESRCGCIHAGSQHSPAGKRQRRR